MPALPAAPLQLQMINLWDASLRRISVLTRACKANFWHFYNSNTQIHTHAQPKTRVYAHTHTHTLLTHTHKVLESSRYRCNIGNAPECQRANCLFSAITSLAFQTKIFVCMDTFGAHFSAYSQKLYVLFCSLQVCCGKMLLKRHFAISSQN